MAYYLSAERNRDIVESYRRYQRYLQQHKEGFPRGAFALGTAEWYQNANDHRCPHDSQLEHFLISESVDSGKQRFATIQLRLLGAYHDGHIELSYPEVHSYVLESPSCAQGVGDWLYDEFRLSASGRLIHEIEWFGLRNNKGSRWIIEASDVEFSWIPKSPLDPGDRLQKQ